MKSDADMRSEKLTCAGAEKLIGESCRSFRKHTVDCVCLYDGTFIIRCRQNKNGPYSFAAVWFNDDENGKTQPVCEPVEIKDILGDRNPTGEVFKLIHRI